MRVGKNVPRPTCIAATSDVATVEINNPYAIPVSPSKSIIKITNAREPSSGNLNTNRAMNSMAVTCHHPKK
jgi:hypothetical protein